MTDRIKHRSLVCQRQRHGALASRATRILSSRTPWSDPPRTSPQACAPTMADTKVPSCNIHSSHLIQSFPRRSRSLSASQHDRNRTRETGRYLRLECTGYMRAFHLILPSFHSYLISPCFLSAFFSLWHFFLCSRPVRFISTIFFLFPRCVQSCTLHVPFTLVTLSRTCVCSLFPSNLMYSSTAET